MKIEGRCRICKREFPIDLVLTSGAGGNCPFCGSPLDADYSMSLVKALANLQRAGSALTASLETVRDLGANLDIDAHSVLEPIRLALAERADAARGAQP